MQTIIKKIGIIVLMLAVLVMPFGTTGPAKKASAVAVSTVTRSFSSATPSAGSSLTVSLAVSVDPTDSVITIDELVPTGWTVTSATNGGNFVSQPGHILWFVMPATSATYQYTVTVPPAASGINIFSGTYGAEVTVPVPAAILGSTSVNVQPATPVLTTINVTPTTPTVVVGNTQQFTASTLDQNGAPITATVAWSSSEIAIGTIDATTGLFTAISAGTTTVMAMSGAIMGSTLVTVSATPPPPVTYSITATSGANGMIMPMGTAGVVTVNSGANQAFTITPNAGFNIADILVDGSSVGAVGTYTFTNVTANHTISASFSAIPVGSFTITSSAGGNGNISPLGALSFAGGTNATYTITPSVGFQVLDVLVDGVSVGAVTTYTFTNISSAHTIAASFTATPVLTSITVTPTAPSIMAGTSQQFTAVGLDQNGAALVTQPIFTWTSGNNLVATIDANGLAQGVVAGGPVLITATSGGISGTASLTVTAVPVLTSVTVAPPTPSIEINATQQLTASPLDQNGVAFTGAAVAWSSSDSAIATVDNNGLVTGVAVGTVTITATATSGATTVTGTSTITVNAVPPVLVLTTINVAPVAPSVVAGRTQQFTAETLDQNGGPIVATVIWTSSDPLVATIDPNTGLATTLIAGITTITATSGTVSGTTLLTITPAPVLTTINVTPATPSVTVGNMQQMTAATLDQNGAAIVATVGWTSSDTAVGTIDPTTGMFTAVSSGTTTITATSGTITGSTIVTVAAVVPPTPVLTTINVTPSTASITVGATQQLSANPLDQNNASFVGATITWSSTDTLVATVDTTTGLVTAVSPGEVTITATAVMGMTTVIGSSDITVTTPIRSSGSSGGGGYVFVPTIPIGRVLGASTENERELEVEFEGCDDRTTGFSVTTGKSCIGNTGTENRVLGAEKFLFSLFLRQGSRGNEVMELQKFLNDKGHDAGIVDGKFGPRTREALIKFQIINKLKGDGIVGPRVRALLNK